LEDHLPKTKAEKRKAAALAWARMASRNPELSVKAAERFTRREWPELAPAFSGLACGGSSMLGIDPDRAEYYLEDPEHPSEWRG
jgi:hypothetical protein